MTMPTLIAVDIGNARIKLGRFSEHADSQLPEPSATLALLGNVPQLDQIASWLANPAPGDFTWYIASVNRTAATRLIDWLHKNRPVDVITLLASGDLPLPVRVPRPDMVGIDRLVDAVAANLLRDANRAAVIVDVGTAITVDLVAGDGAFLGGAILPGIQMSARALHDYTDMLPLVDVAELIVPPAPLGNATVPAMQSGLFWGAVGAVRELIEQFRATSCPTPPQVFLTGGAGAKVAELLGNDARFVPNLTLSGIAVAANKSSQSQSVAPQVIIEP